MSEFRFKVGDLVMYTHKQAGDSAEFVEKYYMKPAKVVRLLESDSYPYEVLLLDGKEKSIFMEKELELVFQTKEEVDTLLIKGSIDQELYEQLIKEIKEEN